MDVGNSFAFSLFITRCLNITGNGGVSVCSFLAFSLILVEFSIGLEDSCSIRFTKQKQMAQSFVQGELVLSFQMTRVTKGRKVNFLTQVK